MPRTDSHYLFPVFAFSRASNGALLVTGGALKNVEGKGWIDLLGLFGQRSSVNFGGPPSRRG